MKALRFLKKCNIINELLTTPKPSEKPIEIAYINCIPTLIREIHVKPFETTNVLVVLIKMRMHYTKQLRAFRITNSRNL